MIIYNSVNDFTLKNSSKISTWIESVISSGGFELHEINYVFCNDDYLNKINVEFLQHDTFTDIISFDYSLGKQISGDIYISTERVLENSQEFKTTFENELHRVMIHGVLHYMGYKDKTDREKQVMRDKENQCLININN